ncbi:MAG: hypothetical protein AB4368_05495 [Xenococcaceae cyanobacterium]
MGTKVLELSQKPIYPFRSNAYLCPANVWTIGYGHTATAKPGMCVNHEQAEMLLKSDLTRFESAVGNLSCSLKSSPI